MIRINLLPVRAERRKEFIRKQIMIAALSLLVTIAVIGILFVQIQRRHDSTKSSLASTNAKIKQLAPIIKKIEEYKKQKAEISKKIAVIIDLDRYRLAPVVVLSDLNQLRPEKLWFTGLKENNKHLSITGVAVDNETIVTFLNNLKQSSPLKNSDLSVLRSQRIKEIELKKFTIDCPLDLESLPEMLKELEASPPVSSVEEQNG
ncbi:MAG: PilN domain-containing protein [Deltaproteobacteria bacterium]|nr:PilN domain-containing protein [Deltaproteobacteria bacterium]